MALQIASCAPAGTLPAWLTEDVGVQRAFDQERQRRVDHMRGVFLRAGLRHQRLVRLLELRLRHHAALLLLRHGRVFHVLVFKYFRFRRIAINDRNIAVRAGNFRLRLEQHAALIVLDLADEVRVNQEAAVGHHRVSTRDLKRRKGG